MCEGSPKTWAQFMEEVYRQGKVAGLSEDQIDALPVERINCSPDEGIRLFIRRCTTGGDPDLKKIARKLPIYMIIT